MGIGKLTYRNISLVATGVLIKGAPGRVLGFVLHNNAAAVRFVKFYDKATAPTVGTDTPVQTIQIAAGGDKVMAIEAENEGIVFSLGIGIGGTQLVADADATAPAANDLVVDVYYR